MRMTMRFRLRTLMLAVSLISLALGTVVARYHRQSKAIADFMDRDVYIYPEYAGPESLRWLLHDSGILVRPMCAQVLLQPEDAFHVRFFGKVHPIGCLGEHLKSVQSELDSRFGLNSFVLVIPPQEFPKQVFIELYTLRSGNSGLNFHETPCGFTNFPQSRSFAGYGPDKAR